MLKTDLHPNKAVKSFRARYKAAVPHRLDAVRGRELRRDHDARGADQEDRLDRPEKLKDAFNGVKNFKGLQGTVSFSEQNHATITTKQLALVRYDAKSKTWKAVK